LSDDIQFIEVNSEKIKNEMINDFESTLGETLYDGDERRIFLNQETQVIVALKNDINETGKQNLLRYASGTLLDDIGDRTETTRLLAGKSKTTLRFTLSVAQARNLVIPKGARVTPDGVLYFMTVDTLIILSGQLYGDVTAESTEGGSKYNNLAPGQIKIMVDQIPFVASVTNLDTSSGGSDDESDDNYRGRIREAPGKFSPAGAEEGYVYWAKTANPDLQDISVSSPTPGQIKIIALMKNGQLPSQAVLDSILAACNDRKRRPLTDFVTAAAPGTIIYNIDFTYYISQDRASEVQTIRNKIELSGGIVDQYKLWQNTKLGRPVNPDYLRQLLLSAGAFRITLSSPVFTEVSSDKIASVGIVTINYGGLISG
jgi:phage-related baseplate assembly protein